MSVAGGSGAATTPADAVALAQVQSPTLAELLGLMLPPSDNFFAEMLVKDLGARFGGAGTTAAGASVVARTISALLGFRPHVVDGSGLSESDHTSPYQVADLLASGWTARRSERCCATTWPWPATPGTLALRMRDTGRRGRCQAKTGTLTGVSNLAGYCQTINGEQIVFAIFTDGISTEAAHTFQDHMTITLADSAP